MLFADILVILPSMMNDENTWSGNFWPLLVTLLVVAGSILYVVLYLRYRRKERESFVWDADMDDPGWLFITEQYGEPDDVVYLTATPTADVHHLILIFQRKGYWVVNGDIVYEENILGVRLASTFSASTTPDFLLVIATSKGDIVLPVGSDNVMAADIIKHLSEYYEDSTIK